MADYLSGRFSSWLAHHEHVVWLHPAARGEGLPAIARFDSALRRRLPLGSFNQRLAPLKEGRFYPSRILSSERCPAPVFRVIEIAEDFFIADFNHPLAGREVALARAVGSAPSAALATPDVLLRWAGMEAPLPGRETDYSDAGAFDRDDSAADDVFYAAPRRVMHVDGVCSQRIAALYGRLVPRGARVLDLMSSWRSHLPANLGPVTGLGMNAAEMADNPQLTARCIHDLNSEARLPFPDEHFDAVVSTVSIEYLVRPVEVLTEVRRILRPGGVAVITFSTRYFPPKVIALWTRLHPMERLGWALQWLHRAGLRDLHSLVEQGLGRASDDRYAAQLPEMDPLFAAWGRWTATDQCAPVHGK